MRTQKSGFFGRGYGRLLALLVLTMIGIGVANAESITKEQARAFAENWLAAVEKPLGTAVDQRSVTDVLLFKGEKDVTLGYIVTFAPEGFMVLSADDRINPVVMVGDKGKYDADSRNTLNVLLKANLTARMNAANEYAPETRGAELPEVAKENKNTWQSFLKPKTRAAYVNVISDVWVDSFVKSTWSQTGNGYNYYTPSIYENSYTFKNYGYNDNTKGYTNNICSGCVATAFAQILRYFEWPQKPIGTKEGSCTIVYRDKNFGSTSVKMNLYGGDRAGGAYKWDMMSLRPSPEDGVANYEQIGALLLDAGLTVGMTYNLDNGDQSGANTGAIAGGLMRNFKYAGATANVGSYDGARANLDARRPLAVSISSAEEGHAIVCDGYGRLDGRWYYHMNLGWGGGGYWFNPEEHYLTGSGVGSLYFAGFAFSSGNIYRQPLQLNEDAVNGKIISGRITDANGSPVAGAKVSIRKKGETKTWQTMLAWYDPKESADLHKDFDQAKNNNAIWEDSELPGAEAYRNTTDANGIWAIDKVANGNYEIVIEKNDDNGNPLYFAGTKSVAVNGNKWGLNFIAETTDNLALESWWMDGGKVYLLFNRELGKVDVNPAKLSIGGKALLANMAVNYADGGRMVAIDLGDDAYAGALSMAEGFMSVDVDGSYSTDQAGMYDVKIVNVSPVVENVAEGTPSASKVTAIIRNGEKRYTSKQTLSFKVTGSNLSKIKINDFQVRSMKSGKAATFEPTATIAGWNSATGIVTVQCTDGDGIVRVDYVPAEGIPFVNGEDYHFDNVGPVIVKAELSKDNKYVDITFNEIIGSTGEGVVTYQNGIRANDSSYVYAYSGNLADGNAAIWREAPTENADGKYNLNADNLVIGAEIPEDTKGTKLGTLSAKISILSVPLARFMFYDKNNNGRVDADEFIFIKVRVDLDKLVAQGASYPDVLKAGDAQFPKTFDPASQYDGKLVLGPSSAPAQDPITENIKICNDCGIYASVLPTINSQDATVIANTLLNWMITINSSGNGIWNDYGKPVIGTYDAEAGDVLICGTPQGKGSALPNTVYFIDNDADGMLSENDVIWFDNGDGKINQENTNDVVLSKLTEKDLNWGLAPVNQDDFKVILHRNGGTVDNVVPEAVTSTATMSKTDILKDASTNAIRVWLKYTPQLEAENKVSSRATTEEEIAQYKVPAGVESIEVRPREGQVFDGLLNESSTANTTGSMLLYDSARPRIEDMVVGNDNYSILIRFSKRVYGNNNGAINNYQGVMSDEPLRDWEVLTPNNFEVIVTYDNGATKTLSLNNNATYQSVVYKKGANFCILDLFTKNADNRQYLDVVNGNPDVKSGTITYKYNGATLATVDRNAKPYKLSVKFKNIYDYYGNGLAENGKTLDCEFNTAYIPGLKSLPPAMFTDYRNSFTYTVETAPTKNNWVYRDIDVTEKTNSGQTTTYKARYGIIETANSTTVKAIKTAYTQIQMPEDEKALSASNTTPSIHYTDAASVFGSGNERGSDKQLSAYGVWYRDLDGDGRIDAVDLNFKNPYNNGSYHSALTVASTTGLTVWVQNVDPEEFTNAPDNEGKTWASATIQKDMFPANTSANKESLRSYQATAWTGWTKVGIASTELIVDSTEYRYTTLRVHLTAGVVRPRTAGDRWIAVSYEAPRYSNRNNSVTSTTAVPSNTYDWRTTAPLAKFSAGTPAVEYNSAITETIRAAYSGADEQAGMYWTYSGNSGTGVVPTIFVVDSFGPVIAWDGAAPVPVTAVAWRATPYTKQGETAQNYEYLDVTFSEPVAYAGDQAMSGYGYSSNQVAPNGFLKGAWGAQVINNTTVRFKYNGVSTDNLAFNFNGWLYDRSGGNIEHFLCDYSLANYVNRKTRSFSGTAIGVKPVDSRYRILTQGTGDLVPMFTVDASAGSITSVGPTSSTTMNLSLNNVQLKAIENGGNFSFKAANWYENGTSLGNTSAINNRAPGNVRSTLTYSLGANALSAGLYPGAGVIGGIGKVIVRNDTYAGYPGVGQNYAVNSVFTLTAPDPVGCGMGYTTELTPTETVLSGPVYTMVKVGAVNQTMGTSRIAAGASLDVLGIDVGGASANNITGIKVRAIDTSFGQFDPKVDFKALADGAKSGLQIVKADGTTVQISLSGDEWSEWKINEEGLPYREVTLRPLGGLAIPTTGGAANSYDFFIRVTTSSDFNLGDTFIIQIPDDGISFGSYNTADSNTTEWGTANGTRGFAFTDHVFNDNNNDNRWAAGDAIMSVEDPINPSPLFDGGKPFIGNNERTLMLSANGVTVKNLYYAKKDWSTNPETSPFCGVANFPAQAAGATGGFDNMAGSKYDLNYNVSYAPGDDVWYDIGGEPGVYDEGIDIPLFGNASKYVLPWSVQQSGAKSAQYRAAAASTAGNVSSGSINAPSAGPVAVVGLDMQDSGRGFGPRNLLNGSIIVELISKNVLAGNYTIEYKATGTISWAKGAAVAVPKAIGGRVVLLDSDRKAAIVIRRFSDELPAEDASIPFVVSDDDDRDIQQPSSIAGVRIHAVGRGSNSTNVPGESYVLKRNGNTLSWAGGEAVDVTAGGLFALNAGKDNYLMVQVDALGLSGTGSESEKLEVYSADGRSITPLMNISGVEIMAVSDMADQGWYTFSYDGANSISWGNGNPVNIRSLKNGDYAIINGDGSSTDYSRNFVLIRRNGASLPAQACTDSIFINQTRLLKVNVTLTNVSGITDTHFEPMTADGASGISLWWDANADGKFNDGDMNVPLLLVPELVGAGSGTYNATLTPDPSWLTAWLSCPQDTSVSSNGHNFFVCVRTTRDMSYGDQFNVKAMFYEPTDMSFGDAYNVCLAQGTSTTVTCYSITNTMFDKMTVKGQTIDANTSVDLASIEHFYGKAISGKEVYMTKVAITIYAPAGSTFHPDTAFTSMDAANAGDRGIVLATAAGKVIPCKIELITEDAKTGPWTYVLRPETSGGDSSVPATDDGKPDHIIKVNLAKTLPYGVSFYARMETDAVTYNAVDGSEDNVGCAASPMQTDILSSTINTSYADLMDSTMVSPTSGLVINAVGASVANGYQQITFGYNVSTNKYTLSWNGNTVEIDITQVGSYALGSGANGLTITFDPKAFFTEDTLVTSDDTGRPDSNITLGAKLTVLTAEVAPNVKYFDANANGVYDDGETIACDGTIIYQNFSDAERAADKASLCVTNFTAASTLSFYDADDNGVYTLGESIFRDTDGSYTLPWMACLIDVDNYVTPGRGEGIASGVKAGTSLVNAAEASANAGDAVKAGLYLYYIDMQNDGLGYVNAQDVIVARTIKADGKMPALTFNASTDKIVLDPKADTEDAAVIAKGTVLQQFAPMDYLRYRATNNVNTAYLQGDSLFLAYADTYADPSFSWTIRINKDRKIRWYNATAPAPFNEASKALSAIAGLDLANSGATDVKLTSLTVRFVNVENFTMDDLRSLTKDINSGVQLWRDEDGNGIFNPDIDVPVTLASAPVNTFDGTYNIVTFSPVALNEVAHSDVDGIYDFFVVVQPSETVNNKSEKDAGDKFSIIINNNDVVLNKVLNQTAKLTSGTITVDNRAPKLTASEGRDTDGDGFIETIVLTFDEQLQPGKLNDTTIWSISDFNTATVLKVTKAELDSTSKIVTLSMDPENSLSTTAMQALSVAYTSDAALLDWAGNAVDFSDLTIQDKVAPVILTTGLVINNNSYVAATALKANAIWFADNDGVAGWSEGDNFWYNTENNIYTENVAKRWLGYGKSVWRTAIGTKGEPVMANRFFFCDFNGSGKWESGEDIWIGSETYEANAQRIWSGSAVSAWTTAIGTVGLPLDNVWFCDANDNGIWNIGEFIWIDLDEDGVFTAAADVAVQNTRTDAVEIYDTDGNGKLDTMKITFSELMDDASIKGYNSTADSFTASSWSLANHGTLTAWRMGDGDVAINDNVLVFTFPEISGDTYDTGVMPALTVASSETYKDQNGVLLNSGKGYAAGSVVITDYARPILVAARSSQTLTRSKALEGGLRSGTLLAGTVISLTFTEPVKIIKKEGILDAFYVYDKLAHADRSLAELLGDKAVVSVNESNAKVVDITITEDIERFNIKPVIFVEDINNAITDIADNRIMGMPEGIRLKDILCPDPPAFVSPEAINYRTDDLFVQIDLGIYDSENEVNCEEWILTVKDAANNEVISRTFTRADVDSLIDGCNPFPSKAWMTDNGATKADYTISFTVKDAEKLNEEGTEDITCNASYSALAKKGLRTDYPVSDGKSAGEDEEVFNANISALWINFTTDFDDAVVSYAVRFVDEEGNEITTTAEVTDGLAKVRLLDGTVFEAGKKYIAYLEGYDEDGDTIATGMSNGLTALEETEFDYPVNDGDEIEVDAEVFNARIKTLWANYATDFHPDVVSFKVWFVDAEGNVITDVAETTDGIAKTRINSDASIVVGATYTAIIKGYDEDGDCVSYGVSNGMTAAEKTQYDYPINDGYEEATDSEFFNANLTALWANYATDFKAGVVSFKVWYEDETGKAVTTVAELTEGVAKVRLLDDAAIEAGKIYYAVIEGYDADGDGIAFGQSNGVTAVVKTIADCVVLDGDEIGVDSDCFNVNLTAVWVNFTDTFKYPVNHYDVYLVDEAGNRVTDVTAVKTGYAKVKFAADAVIESGKLYKAVVKGYDDEGDCVTYGASNGMTAQDTTPFDCIVNDGDEIGADADEFNVNLTALWANFDGAFKSIVTKYEVYFVDAEGNKVTNTAKAVDGFVKNSLAAEASFEVGKLYKAILKGYDKDGDVVVYGYSNGMTAKETTAFDCIVNDGDEIGTDINEFNVNLTALWANFDGAFKSIVSTYKITFVDAEGNAVTETVVAKDGFAKAKFLADAAVEENKSYKAILKGYDKDGDTVVYGYSDGMTALSKTQYDCPVFDGDVIGTDIDSFKVDSTALWANFDNEFKANATRYEAWFTTADGTAVTAVAAPKDKLFKLRLAEPIATAIGTKYITVVKGYDEEGDVVIYGASDGMTAVEALEDEETIEFTGKYTEIAPKNTDSEGNLIYTQADRNALYAKWNAMADKLTDTKAMRYYYRVLRKFGSADWKLASNGLAQPREAFGSAALGNKLYIIGGYHSNVGALSSVEVFDVSSNLWQNAASLNQARSQFACIAGNNSIVVIGGRGSQDEPLDSIEVFNGSVWTTVNAKLPKAYDNIKAVKANENTIWLVGSRWNTGSRGYSIDTEILTYNLTDNTFSGTALTLPNARAEVEIVCQRCADGNELVVYGGYDADGIQSNEINRINVANRVINTYKLTTARRGATIIAVPQVDDPSVDDVWFVGGIDVNEGDYLYDVEVLKANGMTGTLKGTLNIGRYGAKAIVNQELQHVMLVGGFTADQAWRNWTEIATLDGSEWTSGIKTQLTDGCVAHELQLVGSDDNARLVMFGGYDQKNNYLTQTQSCYWVQKLEETEWMTTADGVTSATVTAAQLPSGEIIEGLSYVFEVKAVDEAGLVSEVERSAGVRICTTEIYASVTPDFTVFDPLKPVVAGTVLSARIDKNAEGNVDDIYYVVTNTATGEVFDASVASIPVGTTFSMKALDVPGTYELWFYNAIDASVETRLYVTVASATFKETAIEPTDSTSLTLNVKLNGLDKYSYQLDDNAEVFDLTAKTIKLTNLAVGTHTISLYGWDVFGTKQGEPTVLEFFIKTKDIAGDALTASLSGAKQQKGVNGDTIVYTLTMSEAIAMMPKAADFEVSNGTIASIEAADETMKVFTISVKGKMAKGRTSSFTTLKLKADTLYTATGVSNQPSGSARTLFYSDFIASFTAKLNAEAGTAKLGQQFTVDVNLDAAYAFYGGDVAVLFDTDYIDLVWEPTGKVDEKGNDVPSPNEFIVKEYCNIEVEVEGESTKCLSAYAAWMYDEAGKRIGIKLGGANSKPVSTSLKYMTLTFKAINETSEDGTAISLKALDDMTVDAGLSFKTIGHLEGECLQAVSYDEVNVKTVLDRPEFTVSVSADAVSEADNYNVIINLSKAMTKKLTVKLYENGKDFETVTFKAGVTEYSVKVNKNDNKVTGDRNFAYTISCSNTDVLVSSDAAEITVQDDDTTITVTAAAEAIAEGNFTTLTIALPTGVTADEDITFDLPTAWTVDNDSYKAGIDFRTDVEPTIKAGENYGEVKLYTYKNDDVNTDYAITLTLSKMFLGETEITPFTATAATVTVKNTTRRQGDIVGNDDVVNGRDLAVLLSAMGMTKDDDNWDLVKLCDLNSDGIINYRDLVLILALMDDVTGTRGTAERSVNLYMVPSKHYLKAGEAFTVDIMAHSSFTDYAISSVYANVNYSNAELAWNGTFKAANVVSEAFDTFKSGALVAGGIKELGGSTNTPSLGLDGAAFCVATLNLKVAETVAADSINITLDNLCASSLGGAFANELGTLAITAEPLKLFIGDAPVNPEFLLKFTTDYDPATRGSSEEIAIGMKAGATDGNDGNSYEDKPAAPAFANTYDVRVVLDGRSQDMKWDVRGLADSDVWTINVKVPAKAKLSLSWNSADLPDYYTYTIVQSGSADIDVKAVEEGTMVFAGGSTKSKSYTFDVVVAKAVTVLPTFTYELNKGWCLIGAPFDFDEESTALFANAKVFGFNQSTSAFSEAKTHSFKAGKAYWVYMSAAQTITVKAQGLPQAQAVSVKAGWNFVSPLYSENASYTLPDATLIQTIWFYTSDGYQWADRDADINIGCGYMLWSDSDTTIWPVSNQK